jgi:hypothetical protein
MAYILYIIGFSIFALLGSIHLLYTFYSNKFEAYDSLVTQAMKGTTIILTKETTLWKAWIGFNASHSLGVMFIAFIYITLASKYFDVIEQSLLLSLLPILIGLSYLFLAKVYWFSTPFIGISIATICFVAAAVIINIGTII